MKIQLGYTPDADDAYMLFGLLHKKIPLGDWDIEPVGGNLQVLNDRASRGQLDATMISAATYPLVQERYSILSAGASFGLGTGPMVVARDPIAPENLAKTRVAIPGATTTACAMLQLYDPTLQTRVLPLDKLLPAVESGLVDCALVIHEEFITYSQRGFLVVLDLGAWWAQTHENLPMPVTLCVFRRNLPQPLPQELANALGESIRYAQSHHAEAMDFANQYACGADPVEAERFVRQYVNPLSIDMGDLGRASLDTFFREADQAGVLPAVRVE